MTNLYAQLTMLAFPIALCLSSVHLSFQLLDYVFVYLLQFLSASFQISYKYQVETFNNFGQIVKIKQDNKTILRP